MNVEQFSTFEHLFKNQFYYFSKENIRRRKIIKTIQKLQGKHIIY